MRDLDDLIQAYVGENRLRFEGDSGLENLEKLLKAMGIKGHGFRFGSPIEAFLSDNPGAVEALLEWIGEQDIKEWKENLEDEVEEEDEEDEDD